LKNSTLDLLREIVTFTVSSFNTNCSGGGRKSLTTRSTPKGSSVYLVAFLINLLSFPPIPCTENANYAGPISEPDREDSPLHTTNTIVTNLRIAVRHILHNNAVWVQKSMLCRAERDSVRDPVLPIFPLVPLEPRLFHRISIPKYVKIAI
jgi:hypothetical protein